jgi:hypothetical protein
MSKTIIKTIKFDDGKISRIEVPADATKEQINAFVNSNMEAIKAKAKMPQEREVYDYKDQNAGNVVNSLLSGATFNLADEAMGGIAALYAKMYDAVTGNDSGITYDSAVQSVRDDQEAFAKRNPGIDLTAQVAGSLMTGGYGGAKLLGSQALKQTPKFIKALATPAVMAAEGGLAGFGRGEGMEDSLSKAGEDAVLSAAVGTTLKKIANVAGNVHFRKKAIPNRSLDDLYTEAKDLYKIVDNSGIKLNKKQFFKFKNGLLRELTEQGVNPTDYPKLGKALRKLQNLEAPTLRQLGSLKRNLIGAIKSADAGDVYYANKIDTDVSNFIKNLSPSDVSKGKDAIEDVSKKLTKADDLWHRLQQGRKIKEMEFNASISPAMARHGDLDTAMASEARSLLKSRTRKIGLDDDVQTQLIDLIKGDIPKRITRAGASMSPSAASARGAAPTVATMLAAGAGFAGGGVPLAAMTAGIPIVGGEMFKKIANVATKHELQEINHALVNKGAPAIKDIIEELAKKYNLHTTAGSLIAGQTINRIAE